MMLEQQQLQLPSAASHRILSLSLYLAAALWVPIVDMASEESTESSPWSHYRQSEWPKLHPTCGTSRQSPIDIRTNDVVVDNKRQLKLINYNETVRIKIDTSEYSLSAKPSQATNAPSIRPSWLPNEYQLVEIHFHWGDGSPRSTGSEHMINTAGGSAEMHLVHLKKGLSKDNITGVDDAFVVIGTLLKLGPITNREVANLVVEAESSEGKTCEAWIDGHISLLPPINQRSFYTYPGSLTTPPCQESVIWIVMHSPINISQEKLSRLTSLIYSKDNQTWTIGQTNRMVQPLNQRVVYKSNNVTQV